MIETINVFVNVLRPLEDFSSCKSNCFYSRKEDWAGKVTDFEGRVVKKNDKELVNMSVSLAKSKKYYFLTWSEQESCYTCEDVRIFESKKAANEARKKLIDDLVAEFEYEKSQVGKADKDGLTWISDGEYSLCVLMRELPCVDEVKIEPKFKVGDVVNDLEFSGEIAIVERVYETEQKAMLAYGPHSHGVKHFKYLEKIGESSPEYVEKLRFAKTK